MSESLVGLGHLVHILATLYGVTAVVGSVENLTRQTVSHGAVSYTHLDVYKRQHERDRS